MSIDLAQADAGDPFDLRRFLTAQAADYKRALAEIRAGRKRTHWMWYVFPQCEGLGRSDLARRYAIRSRAEARAYLAHPILGARLRECASAVLAIRDRSVSEIFEFPDDRKLQSCATLFAAVSPPGSIFEQVLDQCYEGRRDENTLRIIGEPI